MADFQDGYNASQNYVVSGDLLNRYAREHNRRYLVDGATHQNKSSLGPSVPSDNPITSTGQIGIAELITNDRDNVRNSAGQPLVGRDARNEPITDWEFRNKWYIRFVYMEGRTPKVANFLMTGKTSLYAFSDRSDTGVNEGEYGKGREFQGQLPLFAPGDKIPCIYYPQDSTIIPLISPPEEVTYYDFGTGKEYLGQKIDGHQDLSDYGEIQARLEFYDPDAKKWYYYRDRTIHMPKDAFGDRGAGFTLTSKMSILMKDDMKFRVMVAKSMERDDTDFEVGYWGCNVKPLGRHWRTDPTMFPFQNPRVLYDYLVTYEQDENRFESDGSWNQLGGTRGIGNTKRRFRDTPSIKNIAQDVTFEVDKPKAIRWNWTAEVTFQITVFGSDTASSQSDSTSAAQSSNSLSTSSVLQSSSSTGDQSSSYSGSLSFSSSSSTERFTTSSTQLLTTSSTQAETTSSTQLQSSSQLETTSSTQLQTTSSTQAFTTSSTQRFSTSGTGSSSTETWCCVTVVTDIKCNDDGTIREVCKTRICWPRYQLTLDENGETVLTDACKIFPEECSPCTGEGTTSGTSIQMTTSSTQSASSVSSVSSSSSSTLSSSSSSSSQSRTGGGPGTDIM